MAPPPPSPPARPRAGRWRDPIWLLLPLTLLPGLWVFGDPLHRFVGLPDSEAQGHQWVQWLLRRAILDHHNLFVHPDAIVDGPLRLYPTDLLLRLPAALLGGMLGDQAAFDIAAWAALALTAVAAALLARELGSGRWGSVLAGAFVALHPITLGFLATGRVDSLMLGWAMLCAVAWLRLLRAPGRGPALRFGLLFGLLPAASPNLAFLAAQVVLPWAVIALLRRGRVLLRPLLLAGAVSSLLGGGFVAGCLRADTGARLAREPDMARWHLVDWIDPEAAAQDRATAIRGVTRTLLRTETVTPWYRTQAFAQEVLTQKVQPPCLLMMDPLVLASSLYPGWLPLGLALLALLRAPRRRLGWLLAWAGLLLLGFGHGNAHMDPVPWPGTDQLLVLAPGELLGRLPGWSMFRSYFLFTGLASVALALLAIRSLEILPVRLRRGVVLGLIAAWCLEIQLFAPIPLVLPAADARVAPELLEVLRASRGPVAMLPLNIEIQALLGPRHGHPLDLGWNTLGWMERSVSLSTWGAVLNGLDPCGELATQGADTLMVLPGYLPQAVERDVERRLTATMGPTLWRGEEGWIWRCEGP